MKIFVNGKEHDVERDTVDYWAIARLARPEQNPPSRELTVTYHFSRGDWQRNGTLVPDKVGVVIGPGMTFTAVHTGGA